MSERLPPSEYLSQPSKRPSIKALRKQVEEGANIYTVIEGVLHRDTTILSRGIRKRVPISDDITKLYGLKPRENTKPSKINELSFLEGFTMAATVWYPWFVRFSKDPSMPLHMTGIAGEMIKLYLPGIKEDGLPKPREEFKEMLEKDPSGETWMRKHLEDHYGKSGPGLDGAISAISGAAKLYWMITDPSPKKT